MCITDRKSRARKLFHTIVGIVPTGNRKTSNGMSNGDFAKAMAGQAWFGIRSRNSGLCIQRASDGRLIQVRCNSKDAAQQFNFAKPVMIRRF